MSLLLRGANTNTLWSKHSYSCVSTDAAAPIIHSPLCRTVGPTVRCLQHKERWPPVYQSIVFVPFLAAHFTWIGWLSMWLSRSPGVLLFILARDAVSPWQQILTDAVSKGRRCVFAYRIRFTEHRLEPLNPRRCCQRRYLKRRPRTRISIVSLVNILSFRQSALSRSSLFSQPRELPNCFFCHAATCFYRWMS